MKKSKDKVTAILLAGGKSSRMGADKSLMDYKGKKLIQHVVDALRPFSVEIVVVANNLDKYSFLENVVFIKDFILDKGPLVGMISGLESIKTDWAFVTSCDTPFLKGELIDYLWKKKEGLGVIPFANNYFEPLLGLYKKNIALKAKNHFNLKDGSINSFLKVMYEDGLIFKIEKEEIVKAFEKKIFINVNDRETYDSIEKGNYDG